MKPPPKENHQTCRKGLAALAYHQYRATGLNQDKPTGPVWQNCGGRLALRKRHFYDVLQL